MVTRLRRVPRSSSNENPAIISLDGAEPDWNVEIDAEQLARLLFLVHVVERDNSLIEFEKVDPVRNILSSQLMRQ